MLRKNEIITATPESFELPDIGIATLGEYRLKIKGALPGQIVSARIKKARENLADAKVIDVLERASYETEERCPHSGFCGGCRFQGVPYEKQLELKEKAVLSLFELNGIYPADYRGITGSPEITGYRNKMEFSFGDTGLGGELSLGMRKKGSWYEVVHVSECTLIDSDMRAVLNRTLSFFREKAVPFYNTRRRDGILRHLVVRKSNFYGSLLVNLITAPGIDSKLINGFKEAICSLTLEGGLAGVLHTENESLSDVVKLQNVRILYGNDYFYERVSGLDFKVKPASFFQTNTQCSELLYKTALEFAGNCGVAYDLYCGTGTITQILSKTAGKAIGIEIVPDAVQSARETSKMNGITNTEFICGDVLKIIGGLSEKPDLIVADPPRDGIHPKALRIIAEANAPKIVYISCNPSSLVRDLIVLKEYGYGISECALIDMFPLCGHVEVCCGLELGNK